MADHTGVSAAHTFRVAAKETSHYETSSPDREPPEGHPGQGTS